MHHHPFDKKFGHRLKDSDELKKKLKPYAQKGMIDALLFGHKHQGRTHNGKWGIPRLYDGSSSTGKRKKKSDPIIQRVIDLKFKPVSDYNGFFHL